MSYILNNKPYIEMIENVKEVVNYQCFLLFCYTLPGFTALITDLNVQYNLGFIAIAILGAIVVFNLGITGVTTCIERSKEKAKKLYL
jgi:hypothetical protein